MLPLRLPTVPHFPALLLQVVALQSDSNGIAGSTPGVHESPVLVVPPVPVLPAEPPVPPLPPRPPVPPVRPPPELPPQLPSARAAARKPHTPKNERDLRAAFVIISVLSFALDVWQIWKRF